MKMVCLRCYGKGEYYFDASGPSDRPGHKCDSCSGKGFVPYEFSKEMKELIGKTLDILNLVRVELGTEYPLSLRVKDLIEEWKKEYLP